MTMQMKKNEGIINQIEKYWLEKGHLNYDQRDFFIEKLSSIKPKYCLEVGFASGHSAVTTLAAAQPDFFISIDLSLDYLPGARQLAESLRKDYPRFTIIEGDSKQILKDSFFYKYFPKGIDFAFVDGDHGYDGCLTDLKAICPYLNKGGIIFVDDYRSGPPNGLTINTVTRAVDDYVLKNNLVIEHWNKNGKGIALVKNCDSLSDRIRTIIDIIAWKFTWIIKSAIRLSTRIKLLKLVLRYFGEKTQRRHILELLMSCRGDYLLNKPSPWLTFDAIEYISRYLKTNMRVFEYGSGGSTLYWLKKGATCVSIEHDPNWYNIINKRLKQISSVDYKLVEPGPICNNEKTNPADPLDYVSSDENYKGYQFVNYVSQIDIFPKEYFDIILIDGRARPSCIRHSVSKVKVGGLMVIDNSERPHYFQKTIEDLKGYKKLEFYGLGPGNEQMWKTDIYIRLK